MEKQFLTLLDVEFYLPLHFISKATAHAEYDAKDVLEWDAKNAGVTVDCDTKHLKIFSSKSLGKLKLKFDSLHIGRHNGKYVCNLEDASLSSTLGIKDKNTLTKNITESSQFVCKENEKQTQTLVSISPSFSSGNTINTDKICLKKRGRPRKKPIINQIESVSEHLNKAKVCSSTETTAFSESNSELISNKCDGSSTNISKEDLCRKNVTNTDVSKKEEIEQVKRKRYGLRGVKLNSEIMGAVKNTYSLSDENEESDNYQKSIDDNDDDFNLKTTRAVSENESEVESETNAFKIKRIKKVRKVVLTGSIPKLKRRVRRVSNVECKLCRKKLTDYTGVYYHVKNKHARKKGASTYLDELKTLMVEVCSACGITCADRKKLMIHEDREHSKTGPVKCNECDKTFKNIPTLRTHIRWMHLIEPGAKRHQCHLCTASFKSSTSLKQHIDQIHYGNKYNQCDICKKKFYNKSQLRRHLRIHSLDESKKYSCTICSKRFIFAFNLKKHIETVHSGHKESFHCSYCGKGFGQKYGMVSHIQLVHFNIFPFSCKECKTTFARSNTFVEHMKSYHKQADFRITETFVKNGKYNKSAEDMYYCSYCSEGFIHIAKLVVHMHSDHSTAFPFRCETCNQGFLEKVFLSVHMMKAHGVVLSDEVNEDSETEKSKIHEILQVITEKEGYPNKLVQLGQKAHDQDVEVLEEAQALEQNILSEIASQGSSLLIEVASGDTTSRYVIEAPGILDERGTVAQDIASLLLAAEQTMQEDGETASSDGPTQINLVLDDNGTTLVSDDTSYVGQGQNELVEACVSEEYTEETVTEPGEITTESNEMITESGEIIPEENSNLIFQVQNANGQIQVVTMTAGDGPLTLNGDLLQFAAMETLSNDITQQTVVIEDQSNCDGMKS